MENTGIGIALIDNFVELKREETLHLEFKTLSSTAGLNRDDRKLLAKAICGLSNAEGGRLVVGIETAKVDGVDVAARKRPLPDIGRLLRLVTALLPEILSPQHSGITVSGIEEQGGAGYLIIDVSSSQNRPHMSVPERRYFRRGSDGTRVLDHAEIRELMFALREGKLKVIPTLDVNSFVGDLRFSIDLSLTLRNDGKVPIVAPYVRLRDSNDWQTGIGYAGVAARRGAAGATGFYGSRDLLIHIDDQIDIVRRPTGLDFRRTGQTLLGPAVRVARENPDTFLMLPFADMPREAGARPGDQAIEATGVFGSENVLAESFHFQIHKQELLTLFVEHALIKERLRQGG